MYSIENHFRQSNKRTISSRVPQDALVQIRLPALALQYCSRKHSAHIQSLVQSTVHLVNTRFDKQSVLQSSPQHTLVLITHFANTWICIIAELAMTPARLLSDTVTGPLSVCMLKLPVAVRVASLSISASSVTHLHRSSGFAHVRSRISCSKRPCSRVFCTRLKSTFRTKSPRYSCARAPSSVSRVIRSKIQDSIS